MATSHVIITITIIAIVQLYCGNEEVDFLAGADEAVACVVRVQHHKARRSDWVWRMIMMMILSMLMIKMRIMTISLRGKRTFIFAGRVGWSEGGRMPVPERLMFFLCARGRGAWARRGPPACPRSPSVPPARIESRAERPFARKVRF